MERLKYLLFILYFCSHASLASYRPVLIKQTPKVRVLVAKDLDKVLITGTDLKRFSHLDKKSKSFSGRKRVRFNCESFFSKNKSTFESHFKLASLSSPTGLVSLKDHKYNGALHIIKAESSDGCDVVNEVGMEEYLGSLLSKEMNASWELEALKAQAVAARTYAMAKIVKAKENESRSNQDIYFDLESSEKDQVSGSFNDITHRTYTAAKETKGFVLKGFEGSLKPIFFHAKCGGKTLRPDQVWSNPVKEYVNVACPFCKDHGKKNWETHVDRSRMTKFLNWLVKKGHIKTAKKIRESDEIQFIADSKKYFKVRAYINGDLFLINKSLFRRYFGRVYFKSNNFKLSKNQNSFAFTGIGHGHGVGMCQLGALDLAKKGWDYQKILAHYFPNHKLTKIY